MIQPRLAKVADAMVSLRTVYVLIGSLNLGMFGVFEVVKKRDLFLVTAKYTDKTAYAPQNYITALLYDFAGPLKDIVQKGPERRKRWSISARF